MKFKKTLIISAVGILTATPLLLTSCSATSYDNSQVIGNQNIKHNKNVMYDYSNLKFKKEMTVNEFGDYIQFLVSFINLGSVYDNNTKVYKWNEKYKEKSNIIYPKIKVDWKLSGRFNLLYDDSVYKNQDESFKMTNDLINIESNVLFRRANITSFFKKFYDEILYKKIKKTKFFKNIDDNYLYANKCLISVLANLLLKAASGIPFVEMAKDILVSSGVIFDGVGASLQNLLKNYILTMIKIYPLIIYNTYAIDYHHRTSYWFNFKKEMLFEDRYKESKEILDDANKELKNFKKDYFALFDTEKDNDKENSNNENRYLKDIQNQVAKFDNSINNDFKNDGDNKDDAEKANKLSKWLIALLKPISSLFLDQFWIQSIFTITNKLSYYANVLLSSVFRELIIPIFVFPNYKIINNLYFRYDIFFLLTNNLFNELKIIFKDTENINELQEKLTINLKDVISALKDSSNTSLLEKLKELYKNSNKFIDLLKDPAGTITEVLEILIGLGNDEFEKEINKYIDKIKKIFSFIGDYIWFSKNVIKIVEEIVNLFPLKNEISFDEISWTNLKTIK